MLIFKYFATVGTLLTAALLALNAYLDQSGSNAAARVPGSTTTASLFLVPPTTQTKDVVIPDVPQPSVAATSAPTSTHSAHHRHRAR
jgi:hypothetical protein